MSTYEYDQPTWQQYMQAMSDALAAPPATASLQGAGRGMWVQGTDPNDRAWNEWQAWLNRPENLPKPGYGEQCADTDGLAGLDSAVRLAQCQQDLSELRAECSKLVERCVQAEVNLARANQERDALRTELAQRMAIPARALRSYG